MSKLFKTLVVIGLIGVAGVASAAILDHFVQINGQINDVKQSVVFDGGDTSKDLVLQTPIAGNPYTEDYTLRNRSEVVVPLQIVTDSTVGIETTYWSSVDLVSKNTEWETVAGAQGTLTYQLTEDFNYEFEATGLVAGDYSLIYYADMPDRFEDWGGKNPGGEIATFTVEEDGIISETGTSDLVIDLPNNPDANISEHDYCGGVDNYDLCHGAKVWLVESSNYVDGEVITWDPTQFLFETDLITRTNTSVLNLGTGTLDFFVKNVLDSGLAPGDYTVTTSVNPL